MKYRLFFIFTLSISIVVELTSYQWTVAALPPILDTPEEVLRTEIITEARSPINGKPLTAVEYAELQTQIATGATPQLNAKIRENVFLLRLRHALGQLFPFLHF
ncbi:MAG: hypothetical protein H0X31_21825 [Nostocaceae cyanobacterium]|nr:hypothetical protein [Nostocaceae cyanobacterium]